MVLHTDLPEDLTAIPAVHSKLQCVVVSILLQNAEAYVKIDARTKWD